MQLINDFLNNTELTAKDTIILTIITSIISVLVIYLLRKITFFLKNIFNLLFKFCVSKLTVLKNRILQLIKRIIRRCKGIIPGKEYIRLEQKRLDGKLLSNKEERSLEKYKNHYKFHPLVLPTKEQEETKEKIKYLINNPPPNYHDIYKY
ncbi:hypothetical protein [Sinanaerobacter sp. ZZT-01]|uniref:hypothetical protein n=1 Tax=Sinanaerobacter sp. ZZT-01 TaxID=3111540 RepID=UPI002D79FA97|nr:hypothetical protein [Sinanaerobacter sp. ZZT-01]WRR92478.1 hypothetical protein U5921_10485 [Sinanaerobacter sp. ZZT-01]